MTTSCKWSNSLHFTDKETRIRKIGNKNLSKVAQYFGLYFFLEAELKTRIPAKMAYGTVQEIPVGA